MGGSFFFMGKFAPYASQSRDATQNSRHTLLIRATPLRIRAIRSSFARRHLEFAPYAPHSRDTIQKSRHTSQPSLHQSQSRLHSITSHEYDKFFTKIFHFDN